MRSSEKTMDKLNIAALGDKEDGGVQFKRLMSFESDRRSYE